MGDDAEAKDGGPVIISIVGLKKSGKTSVVEAVVKGLVSRGYRVGTIKSMMHAAVSLDVQGKDTFRHRAAGADFVYALSRKETALIWDTPGRMKLKYLEEHMPAHADFLVSESLEDEGLGEDVLVIMAAWDPEGVEETWKVRDISGRLLGYSGRMANELSSLGGLPVFNVLEEEGAESLVRLLLKESGRSGDRAEGGGEG
jgi:molybdopterin-guanine dinucleotide biosynthesis protein B